MVSKNNNLNNEISKKISAEFKKNYNSDEYQEIFKNNLEFEYAIIPYKTENYNWVENTIVEIKNFLEFDNPFPKSLMSIMSKLKISLSI